MVVKDETGRRRYIAFRAPPDAPSRRGFSKRIGEPEWHLTVYRRDGVGILRVPHTDVDRARDVLASLEAEPLTTSGTIARAKRRAGVAGT